MAQSLISLLYLLFNPLDSDMIVKIRVIGSLELSKVTKSTYLPTRIVDNVDRRGLSDHLTY